MPALYLQCPIDPKIGVRSPELHGCVKSNPVSAVQLWQLDVEYKVPGKELQHVNAGGSRPAACPCLVEPQGHPKARQARHELPAAYCNTCKIFHTNANKAATEQHCNTM